MNQTVANFRARYAQDTGKLQQSLEQIKGRHAVELASFKQACTDLRTRAMGAEAAFKQLQAREGALQLEASAALNKLKMREKQIKKMALSSHLWASELERLRRENEGLSTRAQAIATVERERDHWRTVAEGEREQRRAVIDEERQKREKIVEAHAAEIARLETELRFAREELERLRQGEEKIRDDQGRAQAELFEACAQLERAKLGEEQARGELSAARAELEASGEQVRKLRFEGPIRELLMAKERELGRVLEASRALSPEDPARASADKVIGVLGRQVEVLRGALSGNVPATEAAPPEVPKRTVTPPPFPPGLLAARITSSPISE
jgi:chromosome segregation ATPase